MIQHSTIDKTMAIPSTSRQSITPNSIKPKSDFWFPFSLELGDNLARKSPAVTSSSASHTNRPFEIIDRNLMVRNVIANVDKKPSTVQMSPPLSSCRYYPSSSTDKSDIFSGYASESIRPSPTPIEHSHLHSLNQATSSTTTSTSSSSTAATSYHHQYHPAAAQAAAAAAAAAHYHHGAVAAAAVGHSLHSPVNNYSMMQNMSPYDSVAASNARCALPSPTIFPPTPPPSAPWNPWAGF